MKKKKTTQPLRLLYVGSSVVSLFACQSFQIDAIILVIQYIITFVEAGMGNTIGKNRNVVSSTQRTKNNKRARSMNIRIIMATTV